MPARTFEIPMAEVVYVERFPPSAQRPRRPSSVFRGDGNGESPPPVGILHPAQEMVLVYRDLRKADNMWRIHLVPFCQGGRRGQPASIPSHDLDDGDGRSLTHGLGVPTGPHGSECHEACGAAVPRTVISHRQVVVDGLWNVHDHQVLSTGSGLPHDQVRRFRRVVAPDGEKVDYIVLPQRTQDPGRLVRSQPAASRAQGSAGSVRYPRPSPARLAAPVQKDLVKDAAYSTNGTIDFPEGGSLQHLPHYRHKTAVHDGRTPA